MMKFRRSKPSETPPRMVGNAEIPANAKRYTISGKVGEETTVTVWRADGTVVRLLTGIHL